MSHELRTPLTSVLGFAALLADGLGGALEPRHARYLENIRESGNQLLRLINNLLDQAKIEAGRMDLQLEPASLESIVESALSMMEGYGATRGVHLAAQLGGDVPAIVVDVAKLRQAILNLLSNAIKFSGRGSAVEVRTRFLPGRGVRASAAMPTRSSSPTRGRGSSPPTTSASSSRSASWRRAARRFPEPDSDSRSRASSSPCSAARSKSSRRSARVQPSGSGCR